MMSTLLVPLDGSELAERALPYAAALAQARGARMILLRVASPLGWLGPPEEEHAREADLRALKQRLMAQGLAVEAQVKHAYFVETGRAICEVAQQRRADLIVMSTHGHGGLGRFIYGSTADQVLRQAETPVLLIPAASEHAWPTDRSPRILVPLDGSDLAATALGPATELATALKAEISLLQVVEPPNYGLQPGVAPTFHVDPEAELAAAHAYLEQVARELRAAGHTVRVRAVGGFARPTLASMATGERADLLVMATHGRGGLARLVLGSNALATLQHSHVPRVKVRPAALRQAPDRPTALPPRAVERPEPETPIMLNRRELELAERALVKALCTPESEYYLSDELRALVDKIRPLVSAAEAATGGPATG
jgi:nucleotide-binding universal stress UspA family protein